MCHNLQYVFHFILDSKKRSDFICNQQGMKIIYFLLICSHNKRSFHFSCIVTSSHLLITSPFWCLLSRYSLPCFKPNLWFVFHSCMIHRLISHSLSCLITLANHSTFNLLVTIAQVIYLHIKLDFQQSHTRF